MVKRVTQVTGHDQFPAFFSKTVIFKLGMRHVLVEIQDPIDFQVAISGPLRSKRSLRSKAIGLFPGIFSNIYCLSTSHLVHFLDRTQKSSDFQAGILDI